MNQIGESPIYKEKIDGVIFTRIDLPYIPGKNFGILKWKPDYLNTVDFMLVKNEKMHEKFPKLINEDFQVYELYVIHG